ncbi:MAG: regulator protein domain, rane protein-like protein [Polaromonas sp.]|nr:regulator protein domain, rane protein-like protein [Polaromonas sp.]
MENELSPYMTGALSGISILVLVLSLLIGYAYTERMLWWHAAATSSGVASLHVMETDPGLCAMLWVLSLALGARALCVATGVHGALRRPAVTLQSVVVTLVALAGLGLALDLLPPDQIGFALVPWCGAAGWYLVRAWRQSGPWMGWLGLGQAALLIQGLFWFTPLQALFETDPDSVILPALAVYACGTYIGMVWLSRLRSENALRVEARERIDPLTGLATERVFLDRVDGAIIRSHNVGYDCALMLIRLENIDNIVSERGLDNSESVVLAASRAIASSLRSQDSAARLANNRFGVIAEGVAPGAANKLAMRMLAHGLRAGEWGLPGSDLLFQIAAVEISRTEANSASLFNELETALCKMANEAGPGRICMLPRRSGKRGPTVDDE